MKNDYANYNVLLNEYPGNSYNKNTLYTQKSVNAT